MDVRQQFKQLWSTAEKPELGDFVRSKSIVAPADILEVAVVDQQYRWLHAQPREAHEYLAELPLLAVSPKYAARLVSSEFLCRLLDGQALDEHEFAARYPELVDRLLGKLRTISHSLPARLDPALLVSIEDDFNHQLALGRQPMISQSLIENAHVLRGEIAKKLIRQVCLRRWRHGQAPNRFDFADDIPERYLPASEYFDELRLELSPLATGTFQSSIDTFSKNPSEPEAALLSGTYITLRKIGDSSKGRYRLMREIGAGNFGRVYAAVDEELKRQVAIKVPSQNNFRNKTEVDAYLTEAQAIASLDHPYIVPVYDVGRTRDGAIYVVSKYIHGSTLAQRIKASAFQFVEAVRILEKVAMALDHAHGRRLIHRDIKPANILLEESTGVPYLVDFGLAVRDLDHINSDVAGTPCYMSPEQALGEGHRLDGRSDIYSLGVVFYEMLSGRRPFDGQTVNELLHKTIAVEPRAPREIRADIPEELQRICLKMLSKRANQRYGNAQELIEDLEHWLDTTDEDDTQVSPDAPIVPRGLRSFDRSDADFFLGLLPGVRNRDGLPESIAFWQRQINQRSPELTFSVGLVYGPSGCGKSSLVKAGLIPRLADHVIPIYVEADGVETEIRLLNALVRQIPSLNGTESLSAAMQKLRLNSDRKIVFFIDQFEQWLHVSPADRLQSELVKALRQCDGARLQVVLMVRDDFAMAAARFMNELEVAIVQGHNFATVDLFDLAHAQRVLIKFGQAFGKLPESAAQISEGQLQFIADAVEGLAEQGKVVPVRLAILAEMLKQKEWQPATLSQIGGSQGIAISFLDDTFSATTANPVHRYFSLAAQHVMRALLPHAGSDLKGAARSQADLQACVGDSVSKEDFHALLRVLDGELRLISPVDFEGDSLSGSGKSVGELRFFQLTHDYLVPALRSWLSRKQRETPRGRAELKLAECTAAWTLRPENRELPTIPEWLNILVRTSRAQWTAAQRKLMRRSAWLYLSRMLVVSLLIGSLGWATWWGRQQLVAKQLVVSLLAEDPNFIADKIAGLRDWNYWTKRDLAATFQAKDSNARAKLNACLGLVYQDASSFSQYSDFLQDRLLELDSADFLAVCKLLEPFKEQLKPSLWNVTADEKRSKGQQLRAACALAQWEEGDFHWDPQFCQSICRLLLDESSTDLTYWKTALRPARHLLSESLKRILHATDTPQIWREHAFELLEDYGRENVALTAECIALADPRNFQKLLGNLEARRPDAIVALSELSSSPSGDRSQSKVDWPEPDEKLRSDFETSQGMIHRDFAFCSAMPLDRFREIVEQLRPAHYRPVRIRPFKFERSATDAGGNSTVLVSAVWTRDAVEWKVDFDCDIEQLRDKRDNPSEPWLIEDIATVGQRPTSPNRDIWIAVWRAKQDADGKEKRTFVIDALQSPWRDEMKALANEYPSQRSIHVRIDADGRQRFSSIHSSIGPETELALNHVHREIFYLPEVDVSLAHTIPLSPSVRADRLWKGYLSQKESDPNYARSLSSNGLLERVEAGYDLGKFDECLELLRMDPSKLTPALTRIDALIKIRQESGTDKESDENNDLSAESTAESIDLRAQKAAWRKDFFEAQKQLDLGQMKFSQSCAKLYLLARSAAQCLAAAKAVNDPEHTDGFARKSIELLDQCWQRRWELKSGLKVRSQWEFRPLFELTAEERANLADVYHQFQTIEQQAEPSGPVSRVLALDETIDTRLVLGESPRSSVESPESWPDRSRIEELAEQGYRVASISVMPTEGASKNAKTPERLSFAILMHKQVMPAPERDKLHHQQARAAIALLHLNAYEQLWPLLKSNADPQVRSLLLSLIPQYQSQPTQIAPLFDSAAHPDVDVGIAQILLMGQYARQTNFPESLKAIWVDRLQSQYKNHHHAGIHSACRWALKQLKVEPDVVAKELDQSPKDPTSQWYTTRTNEHTLSVVTPQPFIMGSPLYDMERLGEKVSAEENRFMCRIPRVYAISTHEVSTPQMLEMKSQLNLDSILGPNRNYVEDVDVPAHRVRYYEAARYCNWLSEMERVPREQWCYEPDQQFESGMRPRANYLQLTGYRLPTEAEWEYACRAGTKTARYFGDSTSLLKEYAGYADNSGMRRLFPRGTFMPNDYGLFDMHGNVLEWCMEPHLEYAYRMGSVTEPQWQFEVSNTTEMVARGGSFFSPATNVRSGHRNYYMPTANFSIMGFRIARTIRPLVWDPN